MASEANRDRVDPPGTPQGPLGDARPEHGSDDSKANPGQPVEPVEDRPAVGSVKPEDYPEKDRERSSPA